MSVYPVNLHYLILKLGFLILSSQLFHLSHAKPVFLPPVKLHPYDRNVLLRIQKHFGGPKSGFWNSSNPYCCPNCFDPVNCKEDDHVISLSLSSGPNLSGPIPSIIADLTFLQQISIDGPGFTGTIPPSISRIKGLQTLFISNTSITGRIPGSLGRLNNLTWLFLYHNKLSGHIPKTLGRLANLSNLDLSSNMLSGSIPASFAYMTSLEDVDLDSNRLSGTIPETFCRLPKLNRLVLSQNQFFGSIPDCLGLMKNQSVLLLSRNQLTGSIPRSVGQAGLWALDVSNLFIRNRKDGIGNLDISSNLLAFDLSKVVFWKNIKWLNISHNKIYGSLPKQLAKLPNLESVDVSYNQLCGPIPSSPLFNKLKSKYFKHNKCLCGAPLPPCK